MRPDVVRVDVTSDDIAGGVPCTVHVCPIALAVRRACDVVAVEVYVSRIKVLYVSEWLEGRTTSAVRNLITEFDNDEPVQPFSFNLRLKKVTR